MKLFNIDCHISVIADLKNIFEGLGHEVDQWSISGYRWVFNLPPAPTDIITQFNWQSIDEGMVDKFYKKHKDELDEYDAFVCCYPPIFLKLFEKFNKPIIVVAATRYDYPVIDDPKRLSWLEDSLNNNKNLMLVANNAFDKAYCEKFLNKEWTHIPSLCDYTGAKYNAKTDNFAYFSKCKLNLSDQYIHQSDLGKYSWQDLYSYNAILHFPYNVSTMSMFEQYQAGVPLILPGLETLMEILESNTIPLMTEIVFPNNNPDRQAKQFLTKEWLSLSDFYNGVLSVAYFDQNLNFTTLPEFRSNKESVFAKWKKVLDSIE